MSKTVSGSMWVSACGSLLLIAGAAGGSRAQQPPGPATEPNQPLAEATVRLENAQAAALALLVSDAWVEGLRHDVQSARVEAEIADLESQRDSGALSEAESAVKLAKAEMKLAAIRNQHARWRVSSLRGLAQAGAVAQRELAQAESELELSRLAMELAALRSRQAANKITPREYQDKYEEIVVRQATVARDSARAELNRVRQMFAAGMVTALDVQWAEIELADAEDRGRSVQIETAGASGQISWEVADQQLASLWVEGATRRVYYLKRMVGDGEKGAKLGLVDDELLRSCREDHQQAERELAEAREAEKEARARLGQSTLQE